MTPEPITIEPHETVKAAFARMGERKIRHLPVVLKGKLVGIVSDRDIRTCLPPVEGNEGELALAKRLLEQPVRQHMTEAVRHLPSTADVAEAVDLMLEHRFGCLPVVDGDELVGVITYFDLLAHLRPR